MNWWVMRMKKKMLSGGLNKLRNIPRLSDQATLGAIPSAVLTLIIFAMLFLAFGVVVDEIVRTENTMMGSGDLPYSQQKHDTVDFLVACFKAMVFVALICVVLFLIMNGVQRRSGVV